MTKRRPTGRPRKVDLMVLKKLLNEEHLTPTECAEAFGVSRSTISGNINQLLLKGHRLTITKGRRGPRPIAPPPLKQRPQLPKLTSEQRRSMTSADMIAYWTQGAEQFRFSVSNLTGEQLRKISVPDLYAYMRTGEIPEYVK